MRIWATEAFQLSGDFIYAASPISGEESFFHASATISRTALSIFLSERAGELTALTDWANPASTSVGERPSSAESERISTEYGSGFTRTSFAASRIISMVPGMRSCNLSLRSSIGFAPETLGFSPCAEPYVSAYIPAAANIAPEMVSTGPARFNQPTKRSLFGPLGPCTVMLLGRANPPRPSFAPLVLENRAMNSCALGLSFARFGGTSVPVGST